MLTYFFSVRKQSDSSPIETLHHDFGENIPCYTTLEGGQGRRQLSVLFERGCQFLALCSIVKK